MTSDEYRYLLDLKSLDDSQLGMLWPSVSVTDPEKTRARLIRRGWVWSTPARSITGDPAAYDVNYLSTRGLRALQREARHRAEESLLRGFRGPL